MTSIKTLISYGIFSILFIFYLMEIFALQDQINPSVEHNFIESPDEPQHRIEFFVKRPQGDGPFPVLFLLHGYQPLQNSLGGKQLVDGGYLEKFVNEGILTVSISVPGFGRSDGTRDWSGPISQKAVFAVIDHFRQFPFVDTDRMGIYGISRGATLASTIHKYVSSFSLQILEAGYYDLTSRDDLPDYLYGMKENMVIETGGTAHAFRERSAIYNTEFIQSKTLILLGEFDDRRTLPSATKLHEQLLKEGKESRMKIFLNEGHALSADKWGIIIPFLREIFFNLYGIGINVSLGMPAIQITKIHLDSPAREKLQVGDVILRISPCNDEQEIDALEMSLSKFISLVLGQKGTALRLYIQHFDKTCEQVVIQRG